MGKKMQLLKWTESHHYNWEARDMLPQDWDYVEGKVSLIQGKYNDHEMF